MRTLGTILLCGMATIVAVALAEVAVRLVRDPVDYLLADPVPDPVFGSRVEPGDAGHDAWGFRNQGIPETAEVVAIGDSQTYGWTAAARDAWPAVLGRELDKPVFNLSHGGYGPVQYRALLESRAFSLAPATVLIGLYFGNDLLDAYRAAYGLAAWSRLRTAGMPDEPLLWVDADEEREVVFADVRHWLSRRSVLYRMFSYSALGMAMRRVRALDDAPESAIAVRVPSSGVTTLLVPEVRLATLDPERPNVTEGMRITLVMLAEMNALARKRGVRIGVVLIPTKERVFAEAGALPRHAAVERLLDVEALAEQRVTEFLAREGIPFVGALGPLRDALGRGAIYPPDGNGHPRSEGYAVIAAAARTLVANRAGDPPARDP